MLSQRLMIVKQFLQCPVSAVIRAVGFLFLFLIMGLPSVGAQERIEIPSSLNPIGSGARALGMGGAFIAVADDATAASWNPGGLIQLETPEISFVAAHFNRTEDLNFGNNPEASGPQQVTANNINYLSAVYPFTLFKRNMTVALNYQHLYDSYRDWNFSLQQDGDDYSYQQQIDYRQEGSLSAIGLAYCIQVLPSLSFGLTLNFWEDSLYKNQWEAESVNTWTGIDDGVPIYYKRLDYSQFSFNGFNYNLGLLWNVNSRLSLGAVFKAPFTADLIREDMSFTFRDPDGNPEYAEFNENQELDMPMSYGFGLSYRFSDYFSTSLDIYRTEWGDFILTDADGNKSSPISHKSQSDSDIDPTLQIRTGAEYLFIKNRYIIPVRGGLFYDPGPAEGNPDDYYGFSIGSGIGIGRVILDAAYQYRFGNDVGGSILEELDL